MAAPTAKLEKDYPEVWHPVPRYDRWLETQHVPIFRGYYIEDLRTMELGPWEERECNAAILVLNGAQGVTETRVTEVPAGGSLPVFKFSLDELFYVLEGNGLTTVWIDGKPKRTFEWQTHSLFVIPKNYTYQISNVSGTKPARIVNFNHLPVAMALFQEPKYFFNNPYSLPDPDMLYGENLEPYSSEAKWVDYGGRGQAFFTGNFFPDMANWSKNMRMQTGRGGSSSASFRMPGTAFRCAIPTMPVGTYKKAHRHGAGISIVIPGEADGYSIMWKEGEEKILVPWHEGSCFIPPSNWYHQHFNAGAVPARYMPFHTARHPLFGGQRGADVGPNHQIEYPDEDPMVRETFEKELAKRGVKSLMPEQCYTDYDFEFDDGEGDD
jgi:mannose-6-phosphate isomerase-like protein (cupin superfamily)